jgi:hypothetical protein
LRVACLAHEERVQLRQEPFAVPVWRRGVIQPAALTLQNNE